MRKILMLLVLMIFSTQALTASKDMYPFFSKKKKTQFQELTFELRCLVCQNENLADSNADLAKDLRLQVYKMVQAGKTKKEIIDYMVSRYGDFVLFKPPLKERTYILWFLPFILVFVGLFSLILIIKKQRQSITLVEITPEQEEKINNLLKEGK